MKPSMALPVGFQPTYGTVQAGTPAFQPSPNPVDFGNVVVETSSSIVLLTISNPGTSPMNFLATPVFQGLDSGDFITCMLRTGQCFPFSWPTSLPAGDSFNVPLVFMPGGNGQRTAQLTFQTDVPGSPQMVQLQGNGGALAINVTSGSSSSTVAAGQTASYGLTVAAAPSVTGAITTGCTGAPAGAFCNAAPNSFSIGSQGPQNVQVTVTTTARSSAVVFMTLSGLWWALAVVFGILTASPRRRRWGQKLSAAGALALLVAMVSCGGGSSGGGTPTPAGTYALTVTANGGGASSSTQLTLIVQ